ncbi:hybrid sensor histidine kinase/response regulator [Marinovum sp.]|uniref:hybrid sensor histidine kinase/response regulator n=1 Tax=Marinovum sp. TaxID=2024839 RepID=UPI002B269715|nr:ATP-binding protein [Marinovum sp.]
MSETDEARIARLVLEAHPAATVIADPADGRVIHANAEGRRLFSKSDAPLESLSGWYGRRQSLRALLSQASASSNWTPLRLMNGQRAVHGRARGVRRDGAEGADVLILADIGDEEPFVQHASQLQRLNDELASRQRAEARMNFALEAAGIGIWEFDVETNTTWRSDRHDAIFGYDTRLPDWSLDSFISHVVEPDRDRVRTLVETAIRKHRAYRVQCQIRRSDGEIRWIAADGAPLTGPNGAVMRLNGVVSDITEAREAELRIEAAQRMDSLGQMAGGLAHDFANIIGIVRLQAEVASLTRDPETVWARLDAILQAASRGADLAARTLAFARREPGVATAVRLRPLVEQVMALTFGETFGALEVDTTGVADLSVFCDPGQLENALLNLTFNARDAIKAASTGDRITVAARRRDDEGMIEITLSDNGPGMTPPVLERAADPFFTTKEGSGGTGLGLSSVAAFCAASGGDFAMRSTPGQGTSVVLILPEARQVRSPEGPRGPAWPTEAPRLRLLLVEDMPQFREAMQLMLTTLGHEVTAFESGAPALAALRDGLAADVLLTDVMLPGERDGFGLARQARALRPGLGVVYMSGYAEDSERAGAPDGPFLRKPVDLKDLAEALDQVTARMSPA